MALNHAQFKRPVGPTTAWGPPVACAGASERSLARAFLLLTVATVLLAAGVAFTVAFLYTPLSDNTASPGVTSPGPNSVETGMVARGPTTPAPAVVAFVRPPLPDTAVLADARLVSSSAELQAAVDCETTIIVVDPQTLPEVDGAFLDATVRSGVALVGLNVPNDDLRAASGFGRLLVEIGNVAPPGSAGHGPLDQPGYSFIWFWQPDEHSNYWSSGQHWFSDGFFARIIHDLSLNARGLTTDRDGNPIPFDEFDPADYE